MMTLAKVAPSSRMKMVSLTPVSTCPWQTSAEVRCHLAIFPSKTPKMVVGAGSLVSPTAVGKTVVTAVGVTIPPPFPPAGAVVMGWGATAVVADFIKEEVLIVVTTEADADLVDEALTVEALTTVVVVLIGTTADLLVVTGEVPVPGIH